MDGALLLIAANESCPQPQTSEHLAALELMGQEHIIILQNKVDLIREEAAREQMTEIRKFVDGQSHPFFSPPFLALSRLTGSLFVWCSRLYSHGRQEGPDHPHLGSAQVQHRRRLRVPLHPDPHPRPRLCECAADDHHSVI